MSYGAERAKQWRALLEEGEWPSQAVIAFMSEDDRLELKKILERFLPEKEYGQGLGVYKSPVASKDANGLDLFFAARAYRP